MSNNDCLKDVNDSKHDKSNEIDEKITRASATPLRKKNA